MLFVTHLAMALHIAAWTGHPIAALIGSLLPDLDHFLKLNGLTNIKKLMKYSLTPSANYPPRPYLHNWIAAIGIGALALILHPPTFVAFFAGFILHLILDCIDETDIKPFVPLSWNIHGPIKYNSFAEHCLAFFLLVSYLIFFA